MANLTQKQENALMQVFAKALESGLDPEAAYEKTAQWAADTDFGAKPTPKYTLGGARRSQKPSSNIGDLVAEAVATSDPSLTVSVFSGQEPKGLAAIGAKYRHPPGLAVDTYVNDIAGKRVRDRDVTDEHAFDFVQQTGGNVGRGGPRASGKPYMSMGANHYDIASLRPGMGQFWGSLDPGFEQEMAQANALHDAGIYTPDQVPTPESRFGPSLVRNSPPDAMGINPMEPTTNAYKQYAETRMAAPDFLEGRAPSTGLASILPGQRNNSNPVMDGQQQFADWQSSFPNPPIPTPRPEMIASQLIHGAVKRSEHERARRSTQGATPTHTNGDTRQDLIARADKGSEEYFPPVPMPPVAQYNPFQALSAFGMDTASNSHQFLNALLKGGAGLY